jgi:hypothetical protein
MDSEGYASGCQLLLASTQNLHHEEQRDCEPTVAYAGVTLVEASRFACQIAIACLTDCEIPALGCATV